MLNPEVGPDLDVRRRPVSPEAKEGRRRTRDQALVRRHGPRQYVDPDESTPDGGRHGQTREGVIAEHADADPTADPSGDLAGHVGHGGDGDRRDPTSVEGSVPEVFQEDGPSPGFGEPAGLPDSPLDDGRQGPLVEGASRKRRQMDDGDPPFHRSVTK